MKTVRLLFIFLFLTFNLNSFSEIYDDNINQKNKDLWVKFYELQAYYEVFEEGIETLEISENLSTKAEIHSIFGAIFHKRTRYDLAEEELNKALNFNPNSKSAQWTISLVYSKTDRLEKGIKRLEKLAKEYPNDSQLLWVLGDLYFENKEFEKAIYNYEKIIGGVEVKKYEVEIKTLLENMIYIYMLKNDLENAHKYMNKFLNYFPIDYKALLLASEILMKLEKNREAIEKLDIVMDNFDPGKKYYFFMGQAYYNLKEYDKAKYYTNESLKLDENYGSALKLSSELNKIH